VDAQGRRLLLKDATFSGLVAAYRRKIGWRHSVQRVQPASLQIVFSPTGAASDLESARFNVEQRDDDLVVRSIDYHIGGTVDHVPPGPVCFRVMGLLLP
jgi:hypothetical protein